MRVDQGNLSGSEKEHKKLLVGEGHGDSLVARKTNLRIGRHGVWLQPRRKFIYQIMTTDGHTVFSSLDAPRSGVYVHG